MRLTTLGAALAGIVASTALAHAQSIHTGGPNGAYFNSFGPAILNVIGDPSDEVIESGILSEGALYFEHTLANSAGTTANIQSCRENPKDLCLGQADLVAQHDGFIVIPTGAKECLFAVTKEEGFDVIQKAGRRIPFSVPSPQSGSFATFQVVTEVLGQEFARVTHYETTSDAVNAVITDQTKIAFFVQLPDTGNPVFEQAYENDLRFIPIVSRALRRYEVNGITPYSIQPNVRVTPGGIITSPQIITTTCTDVVVFFQDPVVAGLEGNDLLDMQELQAGLEAAAAAGLLIPDTGTWRDLFGNMAQFTSETVDGAINVLEQQTGIDL